MLSKVVQIRYKHAWVQLYTGERRSDFAGRREAPGKRFMKSSCVAMNDPYETVSGWSEVPPLHLCTGSEKGRCCQPPLLKHATWTPQHDWCREEMKEEHTESSASTAKSSHWAACYQAESRSPKLICCTTQKRKEFVSRSLILTTLSLYTVLPRTYIVSLPPHPFLPLLSEVAVNCC